MDAEGIAISVLFPTTGLFFAGIEDLRVQGALCRAYNDWLRDYCAAAPERLVGAAVVPLADASVAIAETRRAVEELGFRAVMVRPNPVAGRPLHDVYYDPFWKTCEDLGVPACIHEGTTQNVVQSGLDRFEDFMFRHACSHPHEQQIACLSFTCGGILERFPALRVCFLESGCGWLPSWLERLDEHVESWGFASVPLPHAPSEYFARQCFISCDPSERGVPAVISLLGDDGILFASDYPHPDGIFPGVVSALAERSDLSPASKQKILRTNAQRCFPLS
jgi:predicted TIM-barrel fold metal-dependent hydrolase